MPRSQTRDHPWYHQEKIHTTWSQNSRTYHNKATSSLFLSEMIAELERTLSTTLQNKDGTLKPSNEWDQQFSMNPQQQIRLLRTDINKLGQINLSDKIVTIESHVDKTKPVHFTWRLPKIPVTPELRSLCDPTVSQQRPRKMQNTDCAQNDH